MILLCKFYILILTVKQKHTYIHKENLYLIIFIIIRIHRKKRRNGSFFLKNNLESKGKYSFILKKDPGSGSDEKSLGEFTFSSEKCIKLKALKKGA